MSVDRACPFGESMSSMIYESQEARQRFRPDIEGLRAIAVLLVVIGHSGVTLFAGGYVGVDVFFVISGFLITSLLLGELEANGRLSIPRFYARRAIRLLPAAAVVVLATVAASWAWLPPTRFGSIARDALSTTFYGINYRLAATGTDYLQSTAPPSPLQHFWSLAVEEQFYLVWPVLLLVTALMVGKRRRLHRVSVTIALIVIAA